MKNERDFFCGKYSNLNYKTKVFYSVIYSVISDNSQPIHKWIILDIVAWSATPLVHWLLSAEAHDATTSVCFGKHGYDLETVFVSFLQTVNQLTS